MSSYIDLHAHSTASDGTLTPEDLVKHAHSKNIKVFALTDHDAMGGLAEARVAADSLGMTLINGVEISVTWRKQTLHIVGLNVDPNNMQLLSGLAKLREFRDWRALEIGNRLDKAGIAGAYAAASKMATGESISRTHFAQFLVAQGYAKNISKVFKKYLVAGKPGYVAGDWAELGVAIQWIRDAGGQAVIAHPARYKLSLTKLKILLQEFKESGGEAIEVVSGSHSRDEIANMASLAEKFGLLGSKGSDYHGPENVYREIDKVDLLPNHVTPIWHNWPAAKLLLNND